MKCYFGGARYPGDFVYVEACFAHSHKEAKKILWAQGSELNHECDGNYFDLRVRLHEEFNHLCDPTKAEAYIISDDTTLRKIGWFCDGDASCCECCLYTMDNRFPLNEEGFCEECVK